MTKKQGVLIFLLLGTTLVGCDKLRHTFGLDHHQADAFTIPSNPPLSMPPDYNLRPPLPGAPNPREVNHRDKAQERVVGHKVILNKTSHEMENSLLQQAAKVSPADPNIRNQVEKDVQEDQTLFKKLKSMGSSISSPLSKGETDRKDTEVLTKQTYEPSKKESLE